MVYRKFHITLVVRIILAVITALLLVPLVLSGRNYLFAYITVGGLFGLQMAALIHYSNKINRNLEKFFLAVREQNLSISFADMKGDSGLGELNDYIRDINEIVSRARREKEMQWKYLQYVVENVETGIMAADSGGRIELWNRAASNLLAVNRPRHISQINAVDNGIPEFLGRLKPGRPVLRRINIKGQIIPFSFKASMFTMENRSVTLISFNNIKSELEDNELDSWQKLIRVLTHEIMNSVAPLSSLSSTLKSRYSQPGASRFDESLHEDTMDALRIIETRSRGLIDFVGNYRKLSRLPRLEITTIKIEELFRDVAVLMKEEADAAEVDILIRLNEPAGEIKADRKLVEQILINLVKNALQCFDNRPQKKVELRAHGSWKEHAILEVANNGPEIAAEVLDRIFVPFFTTRENGSGIGLSLSRQIMRLHGGAITVSSAPGKETVFTLSF